MLVVYDSLTGNVDRFVKKLNMESVRIIDGLIINRPFILITYTIGFGEVPTSTENFLRDNHLHMVGVASSGNKNWGEFFANAGVLVSQTHNVPLLLRFELSGTKKDVEKFKQEVLKLEE